MVIKAITPVTRSEENKTNETIQAALAEGFDEVFIIGVKDRKLHFSRSGFRELERRIGALELLKHEMMNTE